MIDDGANRGKRSGSQEPQNGRKTTILVVDDDEHVRRYAGVVLEKHGYRVLEAGSGSLGLECYQEHSSEIGLVLTDIKMPGLSGPDMVTSLLRENASLPIVYMTGYGAYGVPDEHKGIAAVIEKPFRMDTLLAAVASYLPAEFSRV